MTGTVVPDNMGGTSLSAVVDYTFNYHHYDANRIGVLVFMSALLVLADQIGPKRIHIVWFVLLAAFCGGYTYVMAARGYFNDFDNNMYLYLHSVTSETIADIVGMAFFLVWFFPAVLLAVIKLAGLPRSRQQSVKGSSKT